VVRDSSLGGLCVHDTRDDHCASEEYVSAWDVRGTACNRTKLTRCNCEEAVFRA